MIYDHAWHTDWYGVSLCIWASEDSCTGIYLGFCAIKPNREGKVEIPCGCGPPALISSALQGNSP